MAGNGGIIGPVNTVNPETNISEKKTAFTSSGTLQFNVHQLVEPELVRF